MNWSYDDEDGVYSWKDLDWISAFYFDDRVWEICVYNSVAWSGESESVEIAKKDVQDKLIEMFRELGAALDYDVD